MAWRRLGWPSVCHRREGTSRFQLWLPAHPSPSASWRGVEEDTASFPGQEVDRAEQCPVLQKGSATSLGSLSSPSGAGLARESETLEQVVRVQPHLSQVLKKIMVIRVSGWGLQIWHPP